MKDGQRLLAELGGLRPGGLLPDPQPPDLAATAPRPSSGAAPAPTREDAQGNPVYNWTIVDRIFDTYLERGVRPYVQIGFMPKALSVEAGALPASTGRRRPKYDEIDTGWAYPPKDYAKWAELVYQWARHCVERYGRAEVESWYWEVWNEANIGYWRGTPEEFHKLHDYAIDAVRRALPTARVGGPDAAGSGGKFSGASSSTASAGTNYATGKVGTPIDFVSFHAKGSPTFVDGHVRMGIAAQLRTINKGFRDRRLVARAEGQADRDRRVRPRRLRRLPGAAARLPQRHDVLQLHGRELRPQVRPGRRHGVNLEGALTWAFEFEDQPYFAGFRVLATNGIDLPVLNVFRMFSLMGGQRVAVQSSGEVGARRHPRGRRARRTRRRRAREPRRGRLSVLVWHYHDDDVPGPDAEVELELSGLPAAEGRGQLHHYRIEGSTATRSRRGSAWVRRGRPTADQYAELGRSSRLALLDSPGWLAAEGELAQSPHDPAAAGGLAAPARIKRHRPGRGAERSVVMSGFDQGECGGE